MKEEVTPQNPAQQALERERHYIAEELHEGLCQQLCGISIQLKVLARRPPSEASAFANEFAELQGNLEAAIENARLLYRALKPPIWDMSSLVAALKDLVETKNGRFECSPAINDVDDLNIGMTMALFRGAQQATRDFRQLPNAPNWTVRLDADERFVTAAIEVDAKSYSTLREMNLWQTVDEPARGLLRQKIEKRGNKGALIFIANRDSTK